VELWSEGVHARRPEQVAMAAACLAGFFFKISFELVTGNNLFLGSSRKSVGSFRAF